MFPIVQIGPLAIQVPGLILLLGLWLGLSLAERYANRFGVSPSIVYNLGFILLVAGLLGARLSYVIRYPEAFITSVESLFSINAGLLDPLGGAVAACLAGLVYIQRKKLAIWSVLDAFTPALAVLAIAIGFAHLSSGAAFGNPTMLPWGIELWGMHRHPSQIYEILATLIILALLWPGKVRVQSQASGIYFLSFCVISSLSRLFLEAFRGDSFVVLDHFRGGQIGAWIVLAVCLAGIIFKKNIPGV